MENTSNRIKQIRIVLLDSGYWQVEVTKEFAPECGGGVEVFKETGGKSAHGALDVARGMVTLSPARRSCKGENINE